jgi:uroporphyrinogen III methyltransferase/synthase
LVRPVSSPPVARLRSSRRWSDDVRDEDWTAYRAFGGPPASKGTVHLVGSGPGDLGLLTLRAATLLSTCDVVAYDRLAPIEALDLVPPHAQRICVGKRSGERGTTRAAVDALLRDRALAGAAVVRLKGGDPFVFGRGGEEAEACAHVGIPVEIVHGVSSPVAVPGSAGIPVTHRTVSAGFAVVTGHEDPSKPDRQIDLGTVAAFPGTLVFLMGVQNLDQLTGRLREHGRASDTPVAVVQWGSTPRQRTVTGTLDTIVADVAAAGVGSPSVIVVGDVVRLRPDIAWRETRRLQGVEVVLPRTLDRASLVAAHLRAAGADLTELTVATTGSGDPDDLRAVVRRLVAGDLTRLVLTSTSAVEQLRDALLGEGTDVRALAGVRVATVGRVVASAVRDVLAIAPDAELATTAALAASSGTIVLARADERLELPTVVVTRTTGVPPVEQDDRPSADALVAVPSSTVVAHLDAWLPTDAAHVSMGPATTAALHAAGRRVAGEAATPDGPAFVEAIARAAGARPVAPVAADG